MFFPKQPTVGVLNAVLSVSALAGMLCPPSWACLPASSSWACLCPCLLACLPCCLRSCLMCRLLGLVFELFSGWSGILCPPSWACLPASSSWACLCPCLLACLPCCLRSCLMCRLLGLVFELFSGWSGILCPPCWACLPASSSWACLCPCLLACLPCCLLACLMCRLLGLVFEFSPAGLGFCVRLLGLVSQLAFQLVYSLFSLLSPLRCCVRLLSPVLFRTLSCSRQSGNCLGSRELLKEVLSRNLAKILMEDHSLYK